MYWRSREKGEIVDPDLTCRLGRRLPDMLAMGNDWRLEEVGYDVSSPTTAGLYRARFGDKSAFVKVLRSYRLWPHLALLPTEFQALATAGDFWRYEADVYLDGLAYSLPTGLRLPKLYGVDRLDDDHLVMVMEDVRTTKSPWDRERYAAAAQLLGRLNVRLTRNDPLPAALDRTPGRITSMMVSGFVEQFLLPPLLDPGTWEHPLLAGSNLRHDLEQLASRIPLVLEELAGRPQLMSHGDACPQNLLIPTEAPETFVGIDWSPGGMVAAGDDLGQLLIGRAHSGELTIAELAELRELVIGHYHAGLVGEGRGNVTADDVRIGLDGALMLRSAFASLPLSRLAEPITEELELLIRRRLELTRYLVDLGTVSLGR